MTGYCLKWLCTKMTICTIIDILAQIRNPRRSIAMRGFTAVAEIDVKRRFSLS